MRLNTYLNFNGRCAEAFTFYQNTLGGQIGMSMTHGESPAKDFVSADWHDKIMHIRLDLGDQILMGSDAPPEHYRKPQGMVVSVTVPTTGEAERIFNTLADGGKITMPFQKTFWSTGFGMAVDRFGIPWMVNTDQAA
ncbi:MAG: VOC family protein [Betaproteobacteria bacterium]